MDSGLSWIRFLPAEGAELRETAKEQVVTKKLPIRRFTTS